MTDKDYPDVRTMRCPFCGYTCETRSIGVSYCGPHKLGDGPDWPSYWPAVQMHEIKPEDAEWMQND